MRKEYMRVDDRSFKPFTWRGRARNRKRSREAKRKAVERIGRVLEGLPEPVQPEPVVFELRVGTWEQHEHGHAAELEVSREDVQFLVSCLGLRKRATKLRDFFLRAVR